VRREEADVGRVHRRASLADRVVAGCGGKAKGVSRAL
jgi:hypothetical protein